MTTSNIRGATVHTSHRAAPGRKASTSGTGGGAAGGPGGGDEKSSVRGSLRGLGRLLPVEARQERLHAGGVLHGAVRAKEQLRGHPEVQVLAQPAPDEASRALEGLERGDPL